MTLYKNRLSATSTFSDSDAVAVLVDMAVCKSFLLKHLKKSRCFFLLMVRRCRDQGKLNLSVDDLVLVIFHKLKGFLNLCILCQCVEFLLNLLGNLIFHLSFLRFSILSNRSGHLRLPPVRYFTTKKFFCVFYTNKSFFVANTLKKEETCPWLSSTLAGLNLCICFYRRITISSNGILSV